MASSLKALKEMLQRLKKFGGEEKSLRSAPSPRAGVNMYLKDSF